MKISNLSAAFVSMVVVGCSGADAGMSDTPDSTTDALTASQSAAVATPYRSLCCGTRSTLVDGINSAENLLFTTDNRLFATGNDGVFEIRRDPTGKALAVLLKSAGACEFTGITEVSGVIYASCSDLKTSSLYAARLSAAPAFVQLLALPDVVLANGLARDAAGHLYVAQTFQNQILRVTLASGDPFRVAATDVWLSGSGLFTDGLKIFDSAVYWTDFGGIKRAKILPSGNSGPVQLITGALTFFDDIHVDESGILAADYLGNAIRAFGLPGSPIAQTPPVFTNPSSVLPAHGRLGLMAGDLVVTEKGANRIAVYGAAP